MSEASRKSELMTLLEEARAKQRDFWQGLGDPERSAEGTADHWSAKDTMAHITVWNDHLAAQLEAATRGVEAERVPDFDEANRQIFEAHRERSWEELLVYEDKVFARLKASLEALANDVLNDPERFEWTEGRPLWWRIGFTGYYHVLDHLSDLLRRWGEADAAPELHIRIAEGMGTLDDSDSWRGTVTYNLACFYALNDQPGPALENLRRGLQLNPGLVAWSQEDSDLDLLRDLPEFQALYEGKQG